MSAWKRWIPAWLKHWYRRSDFYVRHRCANQNIYHCTVQKCASQWVRGILADERIYRYSGLKPYRYQDYLPGKHDARKLTERTFSEAFPEFTIVAPVYIDSAGFASIPKPPRFKAFFVMRDPRDVLISWYYSSKISHPLIRDLAQVRQDLARLSEEDGLLLCIDHMQEFGLFAAQRSWAGAAAQDANVLLVRYEDMTGPNGLETFAQVLAHCDILLPRAVLEEVLQTHSFENLSGRKPGQEDPSAHFRKGVSGDWRNHFTPQVEARFAAVAGDLLPLWNYA